MPFIIGIGIGAILLNWITPVALMVGGGSLVMLAFICEKK